MKRVLQGLWLFVTPMALSVIHLLYNELLVHSVSLETEVAKNVFSRVLVFDTWVMACIHITVLGYFTVQNLKNLQKPDKYMTRGTVYIVMGALATVLGIISHGWLLDYVSRVLRFAGFMLALQAQACGVGLVVAVYRKK